MNESGIHVPILRNGWASVNAVADGRETHTSFIKDQSEAITTPSLLQDSSDISRTAYTARLIVEAES